MPTPNPSFGPNPPLPRRLDRKVAARPGRVTEEIDYRYSLAANRLRVDALAEQRTPNGDVVLDEVVRPKNHRRQIILFDNALHRVFAGEMRNVNEGVAVEYA
jgi:hypothetical protein